MATTHGPPLLTPEDSNTHTLKMGNIIDREARNQKIRFRKQFVCLQISEMLSAG
jgi:hypothetical protein